MVSGALTFSGAVKSAALFASFFLTHTAWKFSSCPCNKRVKVKVCTEALCPGCQEFVLKEVIPTFQKLGNDVMDLQIVPYGNAMMKNKTVTCQHGVGECDANIWEQCLIYSYPNPQDYLPMLECLENALPMGSHDTKFPVDTFEKCAIEASLAFPKIQYCHDDKKTAWKVLQKAAKETPSEHKYVPWAVINGEHMDEEHDDLLGAVCKAYVAAGGSHPACKSTTGTLARLEKTSLFDPCV